MVLRQDSNVATDRGASGDAGRKVILFRPRARASSPDGGLVPQGEHAAVSPVSDLAEFERTQEQDNYRHRMIVNAIALAFTVVLAVAGIWIAASMAIIRRNQDCALMGRANCGQVQVPPSDRLSGSASRN